MENNNSTTLLENMEMVVCAAKKHRLDERFNRVAHRALDTLSKRMGITTEQALVFSLCLEYGHQRKILMSSVAQMVECSGIRTLMLMNEADSLAKLGLMLRIRTEKQTYYTIPTDVIDAIMADRMYKPSPIENLSEDEFYAAMYRIFNSEHSDEIELQEKLMKLLSANKHIPFVQALDKYRITDNYKNTWDILMICVYANRLISYDDDIVAEHDWEDYFTKIINVRTVNFGHENGTMKIFRSNLIKLNNSYKGAEKDYHYHFTTQAKQELFPNHKHLFLAKFEG